MRRTVLFLCLLLPTAVFADGPFEWALRPNGWGWSDGYHANNNCAKVGHGWNNWAPMYGGGSAYTGDSGIRGCGGPSNPIPNVMYQPTPAGPRPEQVQPPQRPMTPMMNPGGPMMNGPMKPQMPDQEAYRRTYGGYRY